MAILVWNKAFKFIKAPHMLCKAKYDVEGGKEKDCCRRLLKLPHTLPWAIDCVIDASTLWDWRAPDLCEAL